jgi:2-polyprenyl-6-methoxyphenol hydroxylase-like FAD-dependent oxidoreductase
LAEEIMMNAQRILVVGGGIAGMCAAIELRKRGHHVDLVEIDPRWSVYGAGITLSGPTLRAFADIGVIDDIMATGWCADGVDVHTADGQKVAELLTPRVGRPDVPGGGGILRPELARILREHTLASGAAVRCGTTFESIEPNDDLVKVKFTDGRTGQYDLVIGADGLQSKVRETLFPGAPTPVYSGQASWRAVVRRPASITRAAMFMGPTVKAGVNPISQNEMYLFVTEPRQNPDRLEQSALPGVLAQLLAPFGGVIGEIRDGLNESSRIVYRPFFTLLLAQPWHRGRVVLIGDAVHATTPHLASGAGIGVEDALVLAQELDRATSIDAALSAHSVRRFERCRVVIENSIRLGDMERTGAPKEEHAALMRDTMATLLAPI